MTYPNGNKYQGCFSNNLKEGRGIFTFEDGSSYVGDWKNDLKDGKGIFKWPDGSKFNGEWLEGESRAGTLFQADGTVRKIT